MLPEDRQLMIEDCIRRMNATEVTDRVEAAALAGRLGARAWQAVPGLVALLKDGDAQVRKVAALALGDMGTAAAEAVPALREALGDASEAVRRRAAIALNEIGAEAPAA